MSGLFITLEGIEGLGKSTNLDFIADLCQQAGHDVVVTREPGGTPAAEAIREFILQRSHEDLSDLAELMLMFAARAEHLTGLIRPALARGATVICDRFSDASFAYQGGGRGLPMASIATLRDLVQNDLRPDLTILLDAPLEVSAARMAARDYQDRFEQEKLEFFGRVKQAYLDIARQEPARVKIVDADQPLEQVQKMIKQLLQQHIIHIK
jgi:dTMP kinase